MPGNVPQKEQVRRAYGGMIKKLWQQSEEAFKKWKDTGDELYRYGYDRDFGFQTVNPRASYYAKIAKTAEAMQQLGSRLAPLADLTRLLSPRTTDPNLLARTQARSAYLNYTPTQTRFVQQRRQAVNDALCWGGGCLWTGLDARTGLTTSIWDPRTRTLIDAGAKMYEDVRCIFRTRIRPRSEVIREFPEAGDILMKIQPYDGGNEKDEMRDSSGADKERIAYRECWFNQGIDQYHGGSEAYASAVGANAAQSEKEKLRLIVESKNEPVLCLVTEDGQLFWTGPWPIPFYKLPRDGWPVTFYDLYTGTVPTHPHSPLEPGLGIQRCINDTVTQMMARAKICMQPGFAVRKQNGKGPGVQAKERMFNANIAIKLFEVDFGAVPGGSTEKISSYFEQVDWGMEWLPQVTNFLGYLESMYERLTPLSQFLATGTGNAQDRSAQATRVRDRNQMTRIEDMGDCITDADNTVSRKECFASGYLLKSEDVAVCVPEAAANWGRLGTAEMKNPEAVALQLTQGMPLEQVAAMNPEIAAQIQEQAMQIAGQTYTLDEIIYQTDFSIEASSSRRRDIDQQLEIMSEKMNTIVPVQMQSPDFDEKAIAYKTMAIDAKLQGLDKQLVASYERLAAKYEAMALTPPPMPMPTPGATPPKKQDASV